MRPKKINNLFTYLSVGLTLAFLIVYIILISIDGDKFNGWLQIISIVIQLLASFIGVFLAIRMSQWIADKEEKEKTNDLWKRIGKFLLQLQQDINSGKSLRELMDYKSYWLSVENASYESAKVLHNDDKYMEMSKIFSFLSYHINEWSSEGHSVRTWKINSSIELKSQIENWEVNINDMIRYIMEKVSK